MRVTIHQPEHLPWLGFFHKIGDHAFTGGCPYGNIQKKPRHMLRSITPPWCTFAAIGKHAEDIVNIKGTLPFGVNSIPQFLAPYLEKDKLALLVSEARKYFNAGGELEFQK